MHVTFIQCICPSVLSKSNAHVNAQQDQGWKRQFKEYLLLRVSVGQSILRTMCITSLRCLYRYTSSGGQTPRVDGTSTRTFISWATSSTKSVANHTNLPWKIVRCLETASAPGIMLWPSKALRGPRVWKFPGRTCSPLWKGPTVRGR